MPRVRRLPPWAANVAKRLVRSPKTYLRDSGVVHALLGIGTQEQLLGHPVVGASWEGLVIENPIAVAPPGTRPWFYRTSAGAEIDLLIEFAKGGPWAVKVKRSISSPEPGKGFHLACQDVKARKRMVVYPGRESYRINPTTEVVSLPDAISRLRAE